MHFKEIVFLARYHQCILRDPSACTVRSCNEDSTSLLASLVPAGRKILMALNSRSCSFDVVAEHAIWIQDSA
ncbi:hypothetical protein AKJ16_DCAP06455 [Drosera capensis]